MRLDDLGKTHFILVTLRIKKQVTFHGQEGLRVTSKMRNLIAIAGAKLVYGLNEKFIGDVRHIKIYPDQFKREECNNTLQFSWRDTLLGFEDQNDKVNPAIREWAYGLKDTAFRKKGDFKKFILYYKNWMAVGLNERMEAKYGKSNFLLKLAGASESSFFPVCVEHFFEDAYNFELYLPDLYNHLCVLLRQNPNNQVNNYFITEDWFNKINRSKKLISLPKSIKSHTFSYQWHWSYLAILLGLTLCLPVFVIISNDTLISFPEVMGLYLIALLTGLPANYYSIVEKKWMQLNFYFAFTATGYANIICFLFVFLNYQFPKTSWTEEHIVKSIAYNESGDYVLNYENDEYYYWDEARGFKKDEVTRVFRKGDKIRFEVNEGIFGFSVIKNLRRVN